VRVELEEEEGSRGEDEDETEEAEDSWAMASESRRGEEWTRREGIEGVDDLRDERDRLAIDRAEVVGRIVGGEGEGRRGKDKVELAAEGRSRLVAREVTHLVQL
jgi:hypothetical protein